MFHIEYTYKKNGKEYNSSYPEKSDFNKNIFLFRGSNDLGKSTTMQIVALGMYGLDSEDIKEEIKKKMRRLTSTGTEKFQFKFEISSRDGSQTFESFLDDKSKSPRLLLNRVYISKTEFDDKFKLIFDTPDEVTKKLHDSLTSFKEQIANYNFLVESYGTKLKEQITLLDTYEKREARLFELERDLDAYKSKLNNDNERFKSVKSQYIKSRKMFLVKRYDELNGKIDYLDIRLKFLQNKAKKNDQKKTMDSKSKEKFVSIIPSFITNIEDLLNYVKNDESIPKITNLKEVSEFFKKNMDPYDFNEHIFRKSEKAIEDFNSWLNSNIKRDNKTSDQEKELEFLKSIADILRKYVSINPEIPGTNGKSLKQFLNDIEERVTSLKSSLSLVIRVKNELDILQSLTSELKDLKRLREKMSTEIRQRPSEENNINIQAEIDDINKQLDPLLKEFDIIEEGYNSLSEEEKKVDYGLFDNDEYMKLEDEYKSLEDEIKSLDNEIKNTKNIIDELKNTTTRPVNFSKDELSKQSKLIEGLKSKFIDWNKFLENIDLESHIDKNKIDNKSNEFYSALGGYLASIVGYIFYENTKWELVRIDLIEESFIVKNGPPIMFVDIGTGHTSLDSLLAKIKQDYNGKKKILLLDDVGLMDANNIDRLLKEIKDQVISGNVIIAIVSIAERNLDHVIVEGVEVP